MRFYIDYLDYITSGVRNFNQLELRLRFDLLVFGRDTLCLSVPACIKMQDTFKLLTKLDDFWKNGIIKLQLDAKHAGNPQNYFYTRKAILTKAMPESKLVKHFEFIAYESGRPEMFFDTYLSDTLVIPKDEIYLGKEKNTDTLFRQSTMTLFEKHYDPICRLLGLTDSITFTGVTNRIFDFALDNSMLYQRALIEDAVTSEYSLAPLGRQIVADLLDRAFALANAKTSGAVPITLILNQLTGSWLQKLLFRSYRPLYNLICALDWDDVYTLSQSSDWHDFIGYINAFILAIQTCKKLSKGQDSNSIDLILSKLSRYIALLNLFDALKKEAIDAIKNKCYKSGLFSEAQNLSLNMKMLTDYYNGRYKQLIDALCAIDMLANRIIENLTQLQNCNYLLKLGNQEKDYNIRL